MCIGYFLERLDKNSLPTKMTCTWLWNNILRLAVEVRVHTIMVGRFINIFL